MQEINKNIDHLFTKAKTAKVNLTAKQVVTGLAGTSAIGAAATSTLINKLKIMTIMLGSGIAITTTVLLLSASPEAAENSIVQLEENKKNEIYIEPKFERHEIEKTFLIAEALETNEIEDVTLIETTEISEINNAPEFSFVPELKEIKMAPQDITEVGDFHSVVVQIDCDVELFAGKTCGTEVLQAELQDLIDFSISGGVLTVGVKEGREKEYYKIAKHQIVEVELTMKTLQAIQVQGAAVVHSDDKIASTDLIVTIQGSGDVVLHEVAPQSYSVVLSGSGDVAIKGNGSAKKGTVTISGSGDVCVPNIEVEKVDVQISGSGDVNVNAKLNLNVQIAGSGDVSYSGDPETSVSISGSGEVHKGCDR